MGNKSVVTQSKLLDFYNSKVKPYLGGGLVLTELYNGNLPSPINNSTISSTTGTVVMSDSIENYKFIEITTLKDFGNGQIVSKTDIIDTDGLKNAYQHASLYVTDFSGPSDYYCDVIGFYDDTHLAVCWVTTNGWTGITTKLIVKGIS